MARYVNYTARLGEEYHYIFECTYFRPEAHKFLPKYFRKKALSDCHTLPESTNGRVTDSKILCQFVSVCIRFLSVPHAVNAFRVR